MIPEVSEKISGGSDLAAGLENRAPSSKLSISESGTIQMQHKKTFFTCETQGYILNI